METLYPVAVWTDAGDKNRLAKRDPGKVCHPDLVNRILLGETTFEEQLHIDWAYLVRHDFKPDHKITTAQRICQQSDEDCRVTLASFEPLIRETLTVLGIEIAPEVAD